MKKIIFLLMVILICSGFTFPSIPLAVVGVEDCEVEFNSVVYYPETDVIVLSGKVGDEIKVTKGDVTKVYYYVNPWETAILYIDMDEVIVYQLESYESWVASVVRWLTVLNERAYSEILEGAFWQ